MREIIGALACAVITLVFCLIYLWNELKSAKADAGEARLDARNMEVVNVGLEAKLSAEKKTAQERADLINTFVDANVKRGGGAKG